MASYRKKGSVWYYVFVDGDGQRKKRKGCLDKRATEEMAHAAEIEAARVRSGLADPRANRLLVEARRPIGEHVADFIKSLESKGGDPKHVRQTRTYGQRVIDLAGMARIEDLVPAAVHGALDKLRVQGLSARTLNAHTTAIKSFSR